MKVLGVTLIKEEAKKSVADDQLESLVRQGREQFKKLLDQGLTIPVALL